MGFSQMEKGLFLFPLLQLFLFGTAKLSADNVPALGSVATMMLANQFIIIVYFLLHQVNKNVTK